VVYERHRHRWEFNNRYRDELHQAGLRYVGLSPDGALVEIAELADHPYMVGSQFHPEFKSRPTKPHPLFTGFIQAIKSTLATQEEQTKTQTDQPKAVEPVISN